MEPFPTRGEPGLLADRRRKRLPQPRVSAAELAAWRAIWAANRWSSMAVPGSASPRCLDAEAVGRGAVGDLRDRITASVR
jgi:hypothetical protein